jgi:hypothetical protein
MRRYITIFFFDLSKLMFLLFSVIHATEIWKCRTKRKRFVTLSTCLKFLPLHRVGEISAKNLELSETMVTVVLINRLFNYDARVTEPMGKLL